MAEYILQLSWMLPRIPADVSYDRASLACCVLGPSFSAFEKMGVDSVSTVLITGISPVGFGAITSARFRGGRKSMANGTCTQQMGADTVVNPFEDGALEQLMDLTNGIGADAALDCSGQVKAHRLCIDATRRGGKVAFIGQCGEETPLRVSPDRIAKGLPLMKVWHYNLNLFLSLLKVTQKSPLLDLLVSHTLPMSKIQQAIEISASQQSAKIILHPWE